MSRIYMCIDLKSFYASVECVERGLDPLKTNLVVADRSRIDEVFCDVTNYLKTYNMTAKELVTKMIQDVYETTGITATGGVGTNMYLAKIAMDIVAKHTTADKNGVRIAGLDEKSYRKLLWNHRPITDFWRVGKGYAKKLEQNRIYTMGDVARCSIENEELLYKLFGVNAELLIDHAWGYEPTTIDLVKSYKPENNSISSGQVLHCAYDYEKTKLIVREMTDLLVLDLVEKNLVTDQIVLTIGYDVENLTNSNISKFYYGEITEDRYGRKIPKHAHGTINLDEQTSSTREIMNATMELFERIINKNLLVRRINITANHIINEADIKKEDENPSVGVILCSDRNEQVVEYAMSRSLSPTMVSQYTLKLIDKKLLENKLKEINNTVEENMEKKD